MTATTRTTIQPIDQDTLHRLAQCRGVCLSIFLPDQRPGTPTGSRQALLRQLMREARERVGAEFLEPLDALVEAETLAAGGPGVAIFSSKEGVECFRTPGIEKAELMVASHFQVTPLLVLALAPRERFVLGISKKKMRLFQWKYGVAAEFRGRRRHRLDWMRLKAAASRRWVIMRSAAPRRAGRRASSSGLRTARSERVRGIT